MARPFHSLLMPKPIPLPAVIAEDGDTLRSIAERELGSEHHWSILVLLNYLSGDVPLRAGDLVVIGGARPLPFHFRPHAS